MRDDRLRWKPPGAATERHALTGVTLMPVTGLRQTLISGPRVLEDTDAGWPDIVDGDTYRLALRRDRVLEVGAAPRRPGWDPAREAAISDATDLYAVFDLQGPQAFELLQRGTEITLSAPSRSVSRLFFGLDVLLYRRGETAFRLHVGTARAEALVHLLRAADSERMK